MAEETSRECRIVISHMMLPQDANPSGNVHGGVIMKLIDSAAGVVAIRHARGNVVTASIDRLDFHHPVYVGNLVTLEAQLNWVGNSSMEIGVRAESEDLVSEVGWCSSGSPGGGWSSEGSAWVTPVGEGTQAERSGGITTRSS